MPLSGSDSRRQHGRQASGSSGPQSFRSFTFGRYTVNQELGRGAFGSVYKAFDPQLGRDVAIKVLTRTDERALKRFAREVPATARLRHPGIVSVHESGEIGGRPFLVMEFIDGESLAALAAGSRGLAPSRAAELIRDVALAIQVAHSEGVLHRDLKPQNLLLDTEGAVRVLDFGLACLEEARREGLSREGQPLGTPAYMAPEQLRGERVDGRADVYGLGATLYHLLTGVSPLDGASHPMEALRWTEPPVPSDKSPDVPPRLDEICCICMEPNPDDRFQQPAELAQALDEFLRGPGDARAPMRWREPALILGVGALLAAGVLLFGLDRRGGEDAPPGDPTAQGRPLPADPVDTGRAAASDRLARMIDRLQAELDAKTPYESLRADFATAREAAAGDAERLAQIERLEAAVRARAAYADALGMMRTRGRCETILARFDEALKLAAQDSDLEAEIALARGWHLLNRQRYVEAVAAALALSERAGRVGLEARLMHGLSLALGETELQKEKKATAAEARAKLEVVAREDRQGVLGITALASIAGHLDSDWAKASETAERALAIDDTFVPALVARSLGLVNESRYDEALPLLLRVSAELQEDSVRAQMGLAVAYLHTRRLEQSMERLAVAERLIAPKESALVLCIRGQISMTRGNFAGAVGELQRSVELRSDAGPWFLLGMSLTQLGRDDEAESAWRRAYAEDPVQVPKIIGTCRPAALQCRGRRLLGIPFPGTELTPEHERALDSLLAEIPDDAQEAARSALRGAAQGLPLQAWESSTGALEQLAPDSGSVAALRARLFASRALYDRALAEIEHARGLGQGSFRLDLLACLIAWQRGARAQALERFEALASADSEGAAGLSARAMGRVLQGEPADSSLVEQAVTLEPDDLDVLSVAAHVYAEAGDAELALARSVHALDRYGYLAALAATTRSRILFARALSLDGRANVVQVDQAFTALSALMTATQGARPRLAGARWALRLEDRNPWRKEALLWLREAAAREPQRPELPLVEGIYAVSGPEASRASVLKLWREALARDPEQTIPRLFVEAFEKRFGAFDPATLGGKR